MKRTIILFFAVITAFSAYGQNYLQDGDRCFDNGDYACAKTKFDQASKSTSGNDKQIAVIRHERAKNCSNWLQSADQAFNSKNYTLAKENYQNVLDSNPKDEYTRNQLNKCNDFLKPPAITLSISKTNLSFSASGGSADVTVTTNSNSYTVNSLPSWCTVQKNMGYFKVTCSANAGSAVRSGYFTINAGEKTIRINVSQSGIEKKQETTLRVTKENLSFSSSGGKSEKITVYSNADTYSISLVPSWCSVQSYDGYFVVSCNVNYTTQSRSDWFSVIAGNKTVQINISQSGVEKNQSTRLSVSKEFLSFSSSGGISERIEVYSNADVYSISDVPPWCSVQTYNGYFVVSCSANHTGQSRLKWFVISSGGKELKVLIDQTNNAKSNAYSYYRKNTNTCFNCPKTENSWGLTLGYAKKVFYSNYLDGFQFGLRIEPLFKYG